MKKIIFCFLMIYLGVNLSAGRYAGDFMAIGSGVRALGMGGAFSAVADDGSAIYWNASGIAQNRQSELTLMRAFLYNGLAFYDNFTYTQPLPNDSAIGFNWTRLTINDIPIFEERHLIGTNVDQRTSREDLHLPGIPDGRFNSTDDLFQMSFASHFRQIFDLGWNLFDLPVDFYFGGSFKYIRRNVYNFLGEGTGFDLSAMVKTELGTLVDVSWLGDIAFSLNFMDIANTDITWNTSSRHVDSVLFNTKLGLALFQPIDRFNSNLIFSYSKDYVYDKTNYYGFAWKYGDLTEFRIGLYDNNFTAGAGVYLYNIGVDYAFLTNNLGNTNRIGLSFRFN